MINNLLSTNPVYFADLFEPFAIWGTTIILAGLIISAIILYFTNRTRFSKAIKYMIIGFIIYALILGILLLIFEIAKKYNSSYLEDNYVNKDVVKLVFIPLLSTALISLIYVASSIIIFNKKPNIFKRFSIIGGIIITLAVCVSLICIYKFYAENIVGDGYYTDENYGNLNSLALYVSTAVIVLITILGAFIFGKGDTKPFDAKCISFAGVCVALSFTLSYIKLFELPYGGSVTLFSMFPVMLFSYVYGIKKGVIVGLLYGILQAVQDPFIVHPAQFLLDYPIAFSMMGFAGLLSSANVLSNKPRLKFTLSVVIAGAFRWISHVLSGVFAFGAYTLDAISKSEGIFSLLAPSKNTMTNFWIYSTIYNGYVFIDVVLVIVAGILLFSSKGFKREIEKISPNTLISK